MEGDAQPLRVPRALAALAAQRRDSARCAERLLCRAAGGRVCGVAGLIALGDAAGHPRACTGDEGERAREEQGLMPALQEADDITPKEGRKVLNENSPVIAGLSQTDDWAG